MTPDEAELIAALLELWRAADEPMGVDDRTSLRLEAAAVIVRFANLTAWLARASAAEVAAVVEKARAFEAGLP